VCALTGGGYAERVTAPVGVLPLIPAENCSVEAAGLPGSRRDQLVERVHALTSLRPGETLLVHGGTSGSARPRSSSRSLVRGSMRRGTEAARPLCARVSADVASTVMSRISSSFAQCHRRARRRHPDNMARRHCAQRRSPAVNGRPSSSGCGGTKVRSISMPRCRRYSRARGRRCVARPDGEKFHDRRGGARARAAAGRSGEFRLVVDRTSTSVPHSDARYLDAGNPHRQKLLLTPCRGGWSGQARSYETMTSSTGHASLFVEATAPVSFFASTGERDAGAAATRVLANAV
jgi:hypothetical protein